MWRVIFCTIMLFISMSASGASPDWGLYDRLLGEYVVQGEKDGVNVNLVDYASLKNDAVFGELVAQVRSYDLEQLGSVEEKLAYYINAYNILTIQLVLDNWPVKSIKEIGGWFRSPWDLVVMTRGERKYTLDDIEHKIIRPMGDARIHFAVNCASVSCPDLRKEAYRAEKLSQQLDDQVKVFLRQDQKGTSLKGDELMLSPLFKWYEEDFDKSGGDEKFVRDNRSDLNFSRIKGHIKYNWSINGS